MDVKDIVKGNTATFKFYRDGFLFYTIPYQGDSYMFPIDIRDVDGAMQKSHPAEVLEKFIKGAIDRKLFVKKVIDNKK